MNVDDFIHSIREIDHVVGKVAAINTLVVEYGLNLPDATLIYDIFIKL